MHEQGVVKSFLHQQAFIFCTKYRLVLATLFRKYSIRKASLEKDVALQNVVFIIIFDQVLNLAIK